MPDIITSPHGWVFLVVGVILTPSLWWALSRSRSLLSRHARAQRVANIETERSETLLLVERPELIAVALSEQSTVYIDAFLTLLVLGTICYAVILAGPSISETVRLGIPATPIIEFFLGAFVGTMFYQKLGQANMLSKRIRAAGKIIRQRQTKI